MTTQQIIKLASAVATGLDSVLAYADRVSALPIVSPTLAHLWPFIFIGIVALDRGLHAYLDTPAPAQAAYPAPADSGAATAQRVGQLPNPADFAAAQWPAPTAARQPLGQPQKPSA